jgi:hypothetical protein
MTVATRRLSRRANRVNADANDTVLTFSFLAGIGSCLGIAGNYFLSPGAAYSHYGDDEEEIEGIRELIEDAWLSVGNSLRHAMSALPEQDNELTTVPVRVFGKHAR